MVVHRDIRLANIVLHGKTPVTIDFDCAVALSESFEDQLYSKRTTYGGGLIWIPQRVLRQAIEGIENGNDGHFQDVEYIPKPVDDLHAFLLFMMAISYTAQFQSFPLERIGTGDGPRLLRQLERLQIEVSQCPVWGSWWTAAKDRNYEELKHISNITRWPEK